MRSSPCRARASASSRPAQRSKMWRTSRYIHAWRGGGGGRCFVRIVACGGQHDLCAGRDVNPLLVFAVSTVSPLLHSLCPCSSIPSRSAPGHSTAPFSSSDAIPHTYYPAPTPTSHPSIRATTTSLSVARAAVDITSSNQNPRARGAGAGAGARRRLKRERTPPRARRRAAATGLVWCASGPSCASLCWGTGSWGSPHSRFASYETSR